MIITQEEFNKKIIELLKRLVAPDSTFLDGKEQEDIRKEVDNLIIACQIQI